MYDNEKDEHGEHVQEEQTLHHEHEREEGELHQAHERVEAELKREEEMLHQEHVHEEESLHKSHEYEEEEDHHSELVEITVDDKSGKIKPGDYTVVAIKELGGVPQAYNLLQESDGKLALLADDGSVTIAGCEVFHSRVKTGASS